MGTLTDGAVQALLAKQRAFFAEGKTLAYAFRRAQLEKLRQALLRRQTALEEALAADLGKSRTESWLTEIGFVLAGITHTLKHLKRWMKPVRVRSPLTVFPAKSRVESGPYGCALIIGPFNYPVQLLLEPLAAAIAAGNCAVLCPSERTPHTAAALRGLIAETFGEEYVACTEGGAENCAALLRARFDTVFFTGSARVGRIVMRAAAEHLTPVTLELGGKSPVIVDGTAKLRTACERIAWGKFLNAGQTCVAPDYVFVHRSVLPAFLEEMKAAIRRFYGADAKASADYGRIVDGRQVSRLRMILQEDAEAIVYGGTVDEAERYIEPTLLCPREIGSAACMREELFGPLLPVFAYDAEEEPIAYVNAHEKPLALYVFSEDGAAAERILRRTSSGGACINDTIGQLINPNLPFGGVGESGMGSYHGEYGFFAFSHRRAVLRRSTRIRVTLAFPPHTAKKYDRLRKFMK